MTYITSVPTLPLQPFIECYSYWEGLCPSTDLSLKTGTCQTSMQINLHSDELRWYTGTDGGNCQRLKGVSFAGPQSRSFAVDLWQPRMVRVKFRPGGTCPFLPEPLPALHNEIVSLEDLWGIGTRYLQEQLAEDRTPGDIFARLNDFFLSMHAKHTRTINPAIATALLTCTQPTVNLRTDALARRAGLSQKHFIRLFTNTLGLTPKLYLRLSRFENLRMAVEKMSQVDWAATAIDYGYFDQSHLIRDFREFSGMTPTAYLALNDFE